MSQVQLDCRSDLCADGPVVCESLSPKPVAGAFPKVNVDVNHRHDPQLTIDAPTLLHGLDAPWSIDGFGACC